MSGHSKWHNIQRRKGKQDAVRGQLFTRLSKDIYQAAKEGGGNPDTNFRLKTAIERGKQSNLPAESITRTIAKATGTLQGVTYEELNYEGYGPDGVAVLLQIVTDNRNRTAADIRHIFGKRGGNLGETGCVAWMFKRIGQMTVDKSESPLHGDELLLTALDAGAVDVQETDETYIIVTEPEQFTAVRDELERRDIPLSDAELTYDPLNAMEVSEEQAEAILDLVEALEAHDDVQGVYVNITLPEEEED
ncbi:MAG: transcriptional regulator [Alicyclobacillus sp. RIFOXYA1_FULL_53_8]|nr:MAG: transcriptional regulator [Alicyclobacillus sp. RIFOXYA1_FULL_53_8]